jgi:hypothetical protein
MSGVVRTMYTPDTVLQAGVLDGYDLVKCTTIIPREGASLSLVSSACSGIKARLNRHT